MYSVPPLFSWSIWSPRSAMIALCFCLMVVIITIMVIMVMVMVIIVIMVMVMVITVIMATLIIMTNMKMIIVQCIYLIDASPVSWCRLASSNS